MKFKTTKSALLSSVVILAMCFSMFVGSTYAWFTDSVSSAGNVIQSGNLDIEFWMYNEKDNKYEDISSATKPIFGANSLLSVWEPDVSQIWEPGKTQIVYLGVKNAGSLDLKYNVVIDVVDKGLVGALEYAIIDGAKAGVLTLNDWDDVVAACNGQTDDIAEGRVIAAQNGKKLAPESETAESCDYFALAIHMKDTAGNEYKNKSIVVDINVIATQLASEEDSFGPDYDADAPLDAPAVEVKNLDEFFDAIENGYDMLLAEPIVIDADFVDEMNERISSATYGLARNTTLITNDVVIDGNGSIIYRNADTTNDALFTVTDGYTLTLTNITVDGGAIWSGDINPVLQRGTVNSGITTTGAIVMMGSKSHLVLGEGAVLQNNDGANAVNLGTRVGATLTIDGGEIINNHSAAGAIYGGGAITIKSGKINGNHGGIGGAIRAVTNVGTILTMTGGEMNHNYSDGNGGAIWAGSSKSNNVYVLNGGEMAYNYSATTGGAIYAGYYETVKIGGSFKMHDNDCAESIGSAIRFHNHASLVMTGGEIYNHDENAFYLNNNTASITGGKYVGDFGYSGGLGLTLGNAEIDGVISYNLGTNHNTAYLAEEFGSFKFTVNESAANFSQFNFKPAAGYTYTEGDEAKLVCMNEGYSTYWDAAAGTFKLKVNN